MDNFSREIGIIKQEANEALELKKKKEMKNSLD